MTIKGTINKPAPPTLMTFMGEQYNVPGNAICIRRDGSKGKTAWYTYDTKFVRGNTGYEWEKAGIEGIFWGYCEPYEEPPSEELYCEKE